MSDIHQRRVLIIYTGGTIGMRKTAQGFAPAASVLEEFLEDSLAKFSEQLPQCDIEAVLPLIDSSNITIDDWNGIIDRIAGNYDRYDGFVVVHGTDTMAYTASALSFALEGLSKPVVLTGSQVPLSEVPSDGPSNLLGAVKAAGEGRYGEVSLFFNGKLMRGNRVSKTSMDSFDAFETPNYRPFGANNILGPVQSDQTFQARPYKQSKIAVLSLVPGLSADIMRNLLSPPLQAAVIQCYGAGNAPHLDEGLMEAFRKVNGEGVILVGVSQCREGSTSFTRYEAGGLLQEAGFISGLDMTLEACVTKLYYLLGQGLPKQEVKRLFQESLRGELTPSS